MLIDCLVNLHFRPFNMLFERSALPLTLSLLSRIYMELLVKPEILTSYIYEPTFGNAESRLFLFAVQCLNTESM
jgi:hypothetical protein